MLVLTVILSDAQKLEFLCDNLEQALRKVRTIHNVSIVTWDYL
jgi:hypothetical protein